MRILVVDNHEDGMYKCRGELLKELSKENEVFVSVPRGKYTEDLIALGCKYEEICIDRRGTNPLRELKLFDDYRRLIKRLKPDIVFTYSIKPNVYLGIICGHKKIPFYPNVTGLGTSIQDGGLLSAVTKMLYRIGLKKATAVFYQNKMNMDVMINDVGICAPSILVPGSGVNLNVHKYEEYPDDDNEVRFLTIGRIMKDKGTDELISAAYEIKKKYSNVSFQMIGFYDGDYEKAIERAQKDGVIEFMGHQDDVHSYIKQCHAVVHPSYHEGMANALLEGAATGRPVIATDVHGCIETFDDRISGIGFEARNSEALVVALESFLNLPYEQKKQMGINGRNKMEREFDRNIVIDAYLNQIQKNENKVKAKNEVIENVAQ